MPLYTQEEYDEVNTALNDVKEILQDFVEGCGEGEDTAYYWCNSPEEVPRFLEEVLKRV